MTQRVVSLVPSITETLLAWGVEPVACTRFCEQPDLRHVGGTKDPDVEAIVALGPDLVVVNDEENRREDFDALVAAGLDVHVVHVGSVADVGPALGALADRVGVEVPLAELPPAREPHVRVFVPIWKRPWMSIGPDTYGSSVLAHLGAVNVVADARYPELTLEQAEQGMKARGMPDWLVAHLLAMARAGAGGAFSKENTQPIRDIVGRAPITIRQFVQDFKGAFA